MSIAKKLSKKEFDIVIKQNLIESGISQDCFTFKVGERQYEEYYAEEEFNKFIEEMKNDYPNHYKKYNGDEEVTDNKGGAGGELVKKASRYGLMPPKMASVASSSRFCYLALRDGTDVFDLNRVLTKKDVEFEKECKISADSPTAPQLDAYIKDEECDIFVEAKCHEIFDKHKPEFKNKYLNYFKENNMFSNILPKEDKTAETFELPLSIFDIVKDSTRFDIKQFVCHLLGIKVQSKGKKAKLVYLFFKPSSDDSEIKLKINEIFDELADEIKSIFNSKWIKDFCTNNNIELMAIAEESKVMEKLTLNNMINLLG